MQTITARSSQLPVYGVPDEIVYIPEGSHTITPTVNGKPKQITVNLHAENGPAIAAVFESSLQKRLQENVRPVLDFDHKDGPAAGIPRSFRYEPGKGLMLAVDWTAAGRQAIEGRNYSYTSPTFVMGDDGTPAGLPQRGAIAALVNNPAFRNIQRIAASDASGRSSADLSPLESESQALVAAGSASSLDEAFALAIENNPKLYEEYCESLQKAGQENGGADFNSSNLPSSVTCAVAEFERLAQAKVEAGQADSYEEATELVVSENPDLYARTLVG